MNNIELLNAAFSRICREVVSDGHERYNIGTYKEKKLHLILKTFFEPDTSFHEVPFGGFVCDVKRGDLITEVQTTGLRTMGRKLAAFLPECRVRIVFPVITEKRIVWVDPADGSVSEGKRSPKKENGFRLLSELLYISDYLTDENLSVTAVYLKADEYRLLNGWSRDRKKGAEKLQTIPTELVGIEEYSPGVDVSLFLEKIPAGSFTRAEFSRLTGLRGRALWSALKVLCLAGAIADSGESRRPVIYTRADAKEKKAPRGRKIPPNT